MDILLQSSNEYSKFLMITMQSIIDNNKGCINFHIISDDISNENLTKIHNFESEKIFIYVYSAQKYRSMIEGLVPKFHGSYSTYLKLFVEKIVPKSIDRILYLDVDVLCMGNLEYLFNMDMGDYYVMGVDTLLNKPILPNHKYINGGVQLINLNKYRDNDVTDAFVKELKNGDHKFADQSIVHNTISEHIGYLDLKYNVVTPCYILGYKRLKKVFNLDNFYTETEYKATKKEIVIFHCTAWYTERPWMKHNSHPLKKIYQKYLNKFGFYKTDNKYFSYLILTIKKIFIKFFPFFIIKRIYKNKNSLVG